jgi:hypothetical protein
MLTIMKTILRGGRLCFPARTANRLPTLAMALWSFSAYSQPAPLQQSALDQIGALLAEKASWTPVQEKMDSELIHAVKDHRGEKFAVGATSFKPAVKFQTDGRVLVDIDANVSSNLLALITQGGGEIVASVPQFKAVRALVTLDQMETLASSADVRFVRRAVPAQTNTGSVNSQGDAAHTAGAARSAFGISGAGTKVGVLSDSVDYLTNSQSLGDLGPVTVLPGQSGVPGSGEGTAMLEIVHDLAPGAQLYFATAFTSEASFAQNILNLYSNGCNIIIDDVGYYDEPPFQDGIVAQAVNSVTANGALYFSSAANSGNLDSGTSGTWEGDFVDGGTASAPVPEAGRLHSFGSTTYDMVTVVGDYIDLFWSDPWGASTNDYDLFLLDSTGATVVGSSMNPQTGTQNPYESISTAMSAGDRIVIVKYSGAACFLHLDTQRGQLSIATSGATTGHSAATNAFSVAAAPAAAAFSSGDPSGPFPNPFSSTNLVETFSSDGPRHVFYQADGTPITPGDFSSTGGAIRQKPDITAADGVVTTLPSGSGLNPFYGTSAAAPHAGAIAALLWSYNPALTPGQIRALLTSNAIDIGTPGVDRDAGYGIVMAYPILTNLTATTPVAINLQPLNQTVTAGATATFSVAGWGASPVSYFWRRNGSPIAGANAANYATNNVQPSDSGAQFSCLVSNVQGTLISSNGVLTVTALTALQNGGFEAGSFTNWTTSGTFTYSTVTTSSTYVHSGAYGAELGPLGALGYLSQTMATTSGAPYLLSFWLKNPSGGTPNQFLASWNGTTVYNQSNLGATGWTNLQYIVTATTNGTTLQFGARNDPAYFGLDDISITPVPPAIFQTAFATSNAIVFSWSTLAGLAYQLQVNTNLLQSAWVNLGGPITASGSTLWSTNAIGSDPSRFYRVLVLP